MCEALVRELEEALAAEVLIDEEEELVWERVRDKVKRQLAACQRGRVKEGKEENEKDEEDEDKLDGSSGLLVKARGKHPGK